MDNDGATALADADRSAQGLSGQPADGAVQPCAATEPLFAIDVQLVDEAGAPIADGAFELRRDAASCLYGKTDQQGELRFARLRPGTYQLSPYLLDRNAWELLRTESDGGAGETGVPEAAWQPASRPAGAPVVHTIAQGECTAKLADRHGLLPEDVWNAPANAALRDLRKDRNILAPGDRLAIPAPQPADVAAHTGQRYVVRRKGVPDMVRIRFLDDGAPRAGIAFVASLRYADGKPVPDVAGTTGTDGFVVLPAMPNVVQVEIALDPDGDDAEIHVFDIGHVDPLALDDGVRQRLLNLGYEVPEAGDAGAALRAALLRFQEEQGLSSTGAADAATTQRLRELHLS